MDADGYLFVTGRFKEIINSGGEKIVPEEWDKVLMAHPAVAQAVTFAVPHRRLGESIAAAVVLHPHATTTASALRRFVTSRLASYQVPHQILIIEELPKGSTGKIERFSLPTQLGLKTFSDVPQAVSLADATPRTPVEEALAALWAQVLEVERIGIHDDFFQCGGDSILATQLLSRIREATHVELSFPHFFETPTVAGVARRIEATLQAPS